MDLSKAEMGRLKERKQDAVKLIYVHYRYIDMFFRALLFALAQERVLLRDFTSSSLKNISSTK